ncbi:hypothetical protein [Aerosakkonema funiforme]|uniref:Uncharacterized protein n=1 Tax=Aerosakkonema funiforme FACHB-1375 TaxID=2949571 RepID=A0A926VDA8_9CYAN|nr:hypothetical protein [Aerosakkonema funiforme]MBD2181691.1 hypothetical protein [Aerosakkonema funiforme FACHB-1375]
MSEVQITVEGEDSITATEELLAIPGISGKLETEGEASKEGTLATIATIVGLTVGVIEIAERIYKWYQKAKESRPGKTFDAKIESPNGRLLLEDATIEEICEVLKSLDRG